MLTEKDFIDINKQFSNGHITNKSSLDFTIKQTYRSKHWFKTMCLFTRTIIIDHPFEDGNKRTAVAVIMAYLDNNQVHYNPDHIAKLVLRIAMKNITDVRKIGRLIKNVIE